MNSYSYKLTDAMHISLYSIYYFTMIHGAVKACKLEHKYCNNRTPFKQSLLS